MLTLALTGTVSLTVEPEAGDVMVTTRLPVEGGGGSNCAVAGAAAPIIRTSAAKRATSLFNQRPCAASGWRWLAARTSPGRATAPD